MIELLDRACAQRAEWSDLLRIFSWKSKRFVLTDVEAASIDCQSLANDSYGFGQEKVFALLRVDDGAAAYLVGMVRRRMQMRSP